MHIKVRFCKLALFHLLTILPRLALQDGHIGIIKVQMPLKEVIERWATFVANITEERYGVSPVIKISGHINARC